MVPFFFRLMITKMRPIRKTKKERIRTTTPGIMPSAASSQLVLPSVTSGKAVEIPVTATPSNTPKIPRTNTIFQNIDSSPAQKVGALRNSEGYHMSGGFVEAYTEDKKRPREIPAAECNQETTELEVVPNCELKFTRGRSRGRDL